MKFEPIETAPWIEQAQERLPFQLPRCFTDLASHYAFSDFRIKHLHHYDNRSGHDRWLWHVALFRDVSIFEICTQNRLLPIGQPEGANYDRVCLDLNRIKRGDCPMVQLDHEAILLKGKIKIVAEPWPSYRKLIASVLEWYQRRDRTDPSTSSG